MSIYETYENETWKLIEVPKFIKPQYAVSDYGRVKNIRTDKILTPFISKSPNCQYLYVSLSTDIIDIYTGKTIFLKYTVHGLVLSNFTTEYDKIWDPNYIVNHKDGDKLNNRLTNLEWVTYKGNAIHARDNGLLRTGDSCPNSKVDNDTVHKICSMLEDNYSYKTIAHILNMPWDDYTKSLLIRIRKRLEWVNISEKYNFDSLSRLRKHSDELVRNICIGLENGESVVSMHRKYGNSESYRKFKGFVYGIRTRQTYTDISKDYIW